MTLGVCVDVAVDVGVRVRVGDAVPVADAVGVTVRVGVAVRVSLKLEVGVCVGLTVKVAVWVRVGELVRVGDAVGVGVPVGDAVPVGPAVRMPDPRAPAIAIQRHSRAGRRRLDSAACPSRQPGGRMAVPIWNENNCMGTPKSALLLTYFGSQGGNIERFTDCFDTKRGHARACQQNH